LKEFLLTIKRNLINPYKKNLLAITAKMKARLEDHDLHLANVLADTKSATERIISTLKRKTYRDLSRHKRVTSMRWILFMMNKTILISAKTTRF
jgi:hypothetical protein